MSYLFFIATSSKPGYHFFAYNGCRKRDETHIEYMQETASGASLGARVASVLYCCFMALFIVVINKVTVSICHSMCLCQGNHREFVYNSWELVLHSCSDVFTDPNLLALLQSSNEVILFTITIEIYTIRHSLCFRRKVKKIISKSWKNLGEILQKCWRKIQINTRVEPLMNVIV